MSDDPAGQPGSHEDARPTPEAPPEPQAPAYPSFGSPDYDFGVAPGGEGSAGSPGVPGRDGTAPVPYVPAMQERSSGIFPEPEWAAPIEAAPFGAPEAPRASAEPTTELPTFWAAGSELPPPTGEPVSAAAPPAGAPPEAGASYGSGAPYGGSAPEGGTAYEGGAPYGSGTPYQGGAWAQAAEPTTVYPPLGGWAGLPGDPDGPGGPTSAPPPAAPPARRRPRTLAIAALALVSALVGGGVVLAGQQLLDRGSSLSTALPAPGPGSTSRPDGSIAKIAADTLPSVATLRIKTGSGSGTGSGFVIDNQGHILTNNHVVAAAGSTGSISVELGNGTTLPATVVGADASYDLAVVKVSATNLTPLQFGSSADVVVGDGVIAVGAPLGLDATVTSGIVSALNRPVAAGDGTDQSYINAIQTDAAINPGNSGGPLLDMNGKVIGVNSAIARVPGTSSSSGGGNIGVGFAIPSDQAAKTAQQLIATGKAEHPALGVRVDRTYDGDGAKIADNGVTAGSPAASAGLQDGDIVVEFEGKKVTDADALIVAIRARSVGDTVQLKVNRAGKTVDVSMTLQSAG